MKTEPSPEQVADSVAETRLPNEPRAESHEPSETVALQDATAAPASERPVLMLMQGEVAPLFGREDQRDALVEVLARLPALAPESMQADWTRLVEGLPPQGSVAAVCKRCHVEQRLPYLAAISAHPLLERSPGASEVTP